MLPHYPCLMFQHTAARRRLDPTHAVHGMVFRFQHTAARRRLVDFFGEFVHSLMVSTHSRPKAAGGQKRSTNCGYDVSTHSRPKAAGLVKTK